MKFVRPRLGVLAAMCCWASATHAAGMANVDTDGGSPAANDVAYVATPTMVEPGCGVMPVHLQRTKT